MNAFLPLLLTLLLASTALASQTQCPSHFLAGSAPDILNQTMAKWTQELCYTAFGVTHSGVTRTPLWSAEHLTRAGLGQAKGLTRVNNFHPEERLAGDKRAELKDYARSGFDRGHMSPSADMPSEEAQSECFTLANMVPQNPDNNRHIWERIETKVRTLAKKEGELYVVTGPMFKGSNLQQLNGRVMVPTYIYKAVYDPRQGKAAAYVVANEATNAFQVVSIAELEKQAGIDPFPSLSAAVKQDKLDLPSPAQRGGSRHRGSRHGQ